MPKRKSKKNVYTHEIDLTDLKIRNSGREKFRKELEKIKYRGYEVETLADGRRIVITKPGGKFTFGSIKRDDFMVWAYNPRDKTLWLVSHKNILEDLIDKGNADPIATVTIIDALERVYNGEDPDEVLTAVNLDNPVGELPELLLKAYKWIWGQEDVNYPDGKGRSMSWDGWEKNKDGEWIKNNEGISNLKDFLKGKI